MTLGYVFWMFFWILALGLAVLVILFLLRPLRREASRSVGAFAYDSQIYKNQLAEIDYDLERELLSDNEADLARTEISRRLLSSGKKNSPTGINDKLPMIKAFPIVAMILLITIGIYSYLGSPGLSDMPLSIRQIQLSQIQLSQTQLSERVIQNNQRDIPSDIVRMVSQAEAHLLQNPDDGRGWDVLAPIYFRMGEYFKSEQAYTKAIKLEGASSSRYAGLGEAIVKMHADLVTMEARAHFRRALTLNPDSPRPLFFLALGLGQDGKKDEAIKAFRALANMSPDNAPWLTMVRSQITKLKGVEPNSIKLETAPTLPISAQDDKNNVELVNPDRKDIEAISEMQAGDQMDMIKSMVSSLSEKLNNEPNNFEGWQRLLRSYMVLDQPDLAVLALERALKTFPSSSYEGSLLIIKARQLGIISADKNLGIALPEELK